MNQMMEFIKSAKRRSARENAIDLTGVLVDTAIAACNDLAVYETFIKALSYPKDNTLYLREGAERGGPDGSGRSKMLNAYKP